VRVHPDLPDGDDFDPIREHDGEKLHLLEDERFWPVGGVQIYGL